MKAKPSKRSPKPSIKQILAASGPHIGRTITRAKPGDNVRVVGTGFGKSANKTTIWFDAEAAKPLQAAYSSSEFVVTVPKIKDSTSSIKIQCASGQSSTVPLKVSKPRRSRKRVLGEATEALFCAIDEFASLSAACGRAALPALNEQPMAASELKLAAAALDGARRTAQQSFELWMSWQPLQHNQEFTALRTIEFYDEVVINAGLVERMQELNTITYGPTGALAAVSPDLQQNLFAQAAAGSRGKTTSDALTSLSYGDIGFWIHEGVKVVEAVENIFKVLRPSVDAGPVDASVSLGEIFSAIAKFIDIVSQIFTKLGGDQASAELNIKLERIQLGIDLLEGKADRMEEKFDRIEALIIEIREAVRRIEAEVNANNGALRTLGDLLGRTLVGQGWIIDPRQTLTGNPVPDRDVKKELHDIEDKIDRLEEKADRAEEKLDREEEKLDREEEKLDRLGGFAPRPAEGTVANQRSSSDRITASVVALRPQDNKVYLRAAVDVGRTTLDQLSLWSDWVDFDRPQVARDLLEVSLDLQYQENSNTVISALLSARDQNGRVFHRGFSGASHDVLLDINSWSDWQDFLEQP